MGGGGSQRVTQELTPEQKALAGTQVQQAQRNLQLQDLAAQLILGYNPTGGQPQGGGQPLSGSTAGFGNSRGGVAGASGGVSQGGQVPGRTFPSGQGTPTAAGASASSPAGRRWSSGRGGAGRISDAVGPRAGGKLSGSTAGFTAPPGLANIDPGSIQVDPVYSGERVAGFTDAQQEAQQTGIDIARGQNENLNNTINNIVDFGTRGVLDPGSNPYVQGAIDAAINPIQKRLQEQILPGISGSANANGAFGGSRQALLESQALNDFTSQAGDIASQISSTAYGQGLNTFNNIASMLPGLESTRFAGADALGRIGGLQQQQAQNEINANIDQFNEVQTADNRALAELVSLFGGLNTGTGGVGGGTQITSGGGPSKLQSAAGGAATGAAIAGPYGALAGGLLGLLG